MGWGNDLNCLDSHHLVVDYSKSNTKENDPTNQVQVCLICCAAFLLSVSHIIMGISTAFGMPC